MRDSPPPLKRLSLSLCAKFFQLCFNCLIVFFNNLSFSLGRRSVPFTCLLGNESIAVTNGLIYNYSKQSQNFSLRVFSTLQRGTRVSIVLLFGAAEAQRMNWARVSDLFHPLPDTIKGSMRKPSSFSVIARRK